MAIICCVLPGWWSNGVWLDDVRPLTCTEEALSVVCANVDRAQGVLGRMNLVENPAVCLQRRCVRSGRGGLQPGCCQRRHNMTTSVQKADLKVDRAGCDACVDRQVGAGTVFY